MDAKDKFDACMEIAKLGANNFNERRNFEWKVTLGILGASRRRNCVH